MRCARECDADVYVMGNLGARDLAVSRHCAKFVLSHAIINGSYDEGLALEINCLARELGVAMVLPADAPSTRALIACRHLLEVPCFPLPDLEQFDFLNNKWQFARLCGELGIRHPRTRIFSDIDALEAEIAAGGIACPAVVKALSLAGSQGLIVLNGGDATTQLKRVNYRPILVQEFVPGRDIGASVYCQDGKVTAFIAHELRRRVYRTFRNDAIFHDIERIAARVGAEGVYNFDMIAGDDGNIYYLECNPRFFFKINLSMLAGINFVALGLRDNRGLEVLRVPDGTVVRAPEATLISPRSWLSLTRKDRAAFSYLLVDPFYHIFEELRWIA
jgi:predicted ATP-grasp superfamily ATP-dependent carboligase